ncbi:MAG: DeoR/GlpR transcriptional regulator [Ruminococcaceae bacterium]|nr:DeoR/GlpR transcriptional regulator [Oscillospiraceae bacterium]
MRKKTQKGRKNMYKCEREDEILALLNETGYATVEYLSGKMNISASSIRRDLKNLEERGLVKRSYGGVKIVESGGKRVPFDLRSHENSAQKKAIAKAALSLIGEGDTVFLDGSSSACFVAELLPTIGGVTVVTNGIDALERLSGYDVKVYSTGGMSSPENRKVLVGGFAQDFLRRMRADVAMISAQAVAADGSIYDCYAEEIAVRDRMLANARRKILLCDSSKLGQISPFLQGNVRDFDFVVSDADLSSIFDEPEPEKYILA